LDRIKKGMRSSSLRILLAEDDDSDVLFLRRAFNKVEVKNPLHAVSDGLQAIQTLSQIALNPEERLPALVILDLKMPRRNGMEVLQWMRQQPVIRSIPVFIFSSSSNQSDVEMAYESGANAFLTKPPSLVEREEVARFVKNWLSVTQPPLAASESFRSARTQRWVWNSNGS
jgi:CheY-like chemotaxis protein